MAEEWLAARDARRAAENRRRIGPTTPRVPPPREPDPAEDLGITIRLTTTTDRPAIRRLAELHGRKAPTGEMLLAIVCGQLRAALPLDGRETIEDPFFPTAGLVDLLSVRAMTLLAADDARTRQLRGWIAHAWR
jgi:hypothetical protein